MRPSPLLLAAAMAALAGCGPSGAGGYCEVKAVDGIFESFKDGCIALTVSDDPTKPMRVDTSPSDLKVYVDALNDAYFYFPSNLYVGRRGSCAIGIDTSVDQGERYSCDFRVKSAQKLEQGNQEFVLEVLHSYLSVYGKFGTFEGSFHVTTLPESTL